MAFVPFDGELDDEKGSFVPFEGELDAGSAQKFTPFTGELDQERPDANYSNEGRNNKKKAGVGTGMASAWANVGNMADTAGSLLAGGAAGLFGQEEERDRIFKNMEERVASRNQWANPLKEEIGFGGKMAGLAVTLPLQIAAAGLSPAETGKELINAGESTGTALKGAGIDAVGNAVGMILPGFKQGSLAVRGLTGFGTNAAQEAATKQAISSLASTKEGKEKFAPNVEDVALAGLMGGAFASAAGKGGTKGSKAKDAPMNALEAMNADMAKKALEAPVDAAQGDLFPAERTSAQAAQDSLQGPSRPLPEAPVLPMEGSGPVAPGSRRQMELPMETEALPQYNVTREGVATDPMDTNAMLARNQQMDAVQAQLDAARAAEMREAQPHNVTNDLSGQADLFDSGNPTPYTLGEGQWHVDENGMPIRSDLSMEANNLEAPLQRNLFGDELAPSLEQTRSLTEAIDSMPDGPERMGALERLGDIRTEEAILKATGEAIKPSGLGFNRSTRKQGGAIGFDLQRRKAREESPVQWFTSSPEAGRKTGYSLEEQSARPNANDQRYGPGQYIAASRDVSSVYGGPTGRMYTVDTPFERPFDINKGTNEAVYQRLVEASGSRAGANAALKRAGYDAITFTSPRGDKLANIFDAKPLQDVGPAREKIREQELTLQEYEPGKPARTIGGKNRSQQGGFIKLPFGSKTKAEKIQNMEMFREKMKPLAMDRLTPEEFIATHKNTPDVQQNVLQKASNLFTKGSIYMADRLNNPLYKKVTERFREADSLAKGQQQAIVHDMYAPAARKLNDGEQAEAWGALKSMEASGKRYTSDELVNFGFNQNQRDFIKIHQDTMDNVIPKINEALEAVGMSHIHPEAAYVASKLQGTFRKVMLDKDNNIIGALGDRREGGLAKQVAEFKKLYPDAVEGKTQVMKGQRASSNNIADVLNFLSENDPHMAEFLKKSAEAGASEAMRYRGAKTHTMAKKGVVGMAGNKPWESAVTNAKEGIEAQMTYLNRMLEWAEKAKAEADIRPLLDSPELNMPNAKQLASDYRNYALGQNPYGFAKVSDALGSWFDTAAGGNLSYLSDVGRGTRKGVNIKLLSANPGFLAANIVQPIRNMPEIAALLKSRGATNTEVLGLGSMAKVTGELALGNQTGKYPPLMKEAMEYAEKNHVYASDLIESRSGATRFGQGEGVGGKAMSSAQALEHILQKPASMIENGSRQAFFHTLVDMLHKNGIRKEDGLFDIAANLTDRGMNRYSMEESPILIKAMGGAGKYPYNLMSFKFNELSRLASLAREFNPKELASAKPFLTALTMQVAMAGLMGTIGYTEADFFVKQISKLMDAPTSLTKILLENADEQIVGPVTVGGLARGGLGSATGVDFSGRLGLGALLGSPPGPDMLLPGASAIGAAAESAYDLATNPSKYNAAKAAIDILPGGQMLDRHFFSKTTEDGREIGFNRNKVEAGVERTTADKWAKNFGMTGTNEANKKALLFENQNADRVMTDKRVSAVEKMAQDVFMNGEPDPKNVEKFIKLGGDVQASLETILQNQNIPVDVRDKIKAATSQGIEGAGKMRRRFL